MHPAATLETSAVARAVVLAVAGDTAMVRLRDGTTVRASVELGACAAGAAIVVARDADGWFALPSSLRTSDGTHARVEGDAIVVRDAAGRRLAEHRGGTTRLRAEDDLELTAGRRVVIHAPDGVHITSEEARVLIDPEELRIDAPSVEVSGDRARLSFREALLTSVSLTTAVERAKHVAGVVDLEATRIVERAKRVYREAEELSQTRAGRIRQIAEGTMHLFAGRAVMRADEDIAIKGEKIHLA